MTRHSSAGPSPLRVLCLVVVLGALLVTATRFDLIGRLEGLGAQGLQDYTAGKVEGAYGDRLRLAGRAERPPLDVIASSPVLVRPFHRRQVPAGEHLVAVPLQITNRGASTYSFPVDTAISLADSSGGDHGVATGVRRVVGARLLPGGFALPPGRKVRGDLVFELPSGMTPTTLTVTVGAGLTRTALWSPAVAQ